jgi:hypothetical protein
MFIVPSPTTNDGQPEDDPYAEVIRDTTERLVQTAAIAMMEQQWVAASQCVSLCSLLERWGRYNEDD